MNNKSKVLFANYVSRLMTCPRNFEMWRIKAVEEFLNSGETISNSGVKRYVENLDISKSHTRIEIEQLLRDFLIFKSYEIPKSDEVKGIKLNTLNHRLQVDIEDSIRDFGKWLVQDQEFSPNTAKSYIYSVRYFLSTFPILCQKNAVTYKQSLLSSGLSYKTINIRMSGISSYGKFLGKDIVIKRLRVPRAMECNNVPTNEEMKIYLDNVRKWNRYWYLVSRCLSTTGLRVHELLKITYSDILSGSVVLVGKGGKPRRIFFQQKFIEEIEDYLTTKSISKEEHFCSKTTRGVAQQIRNYSKRSGLDETKFHPHAFRHYFAKQYLERKPTDIVGLQNLLGHSSIETTSIYLQRSYEEQLNDYHNNVNWE